MPDVTEACPFAVTWHVSAGDSGLEDLSTAVTWDLSPRRNEGEN